MGGKAKGDGDNDLAGGHPRWDVHCATILLQRVDGDPADETTGPIVSGQWPAARLRTKHFIPSIPHPLFAALVGATDHRMEEDGPRRLRVVQYERGAVVAHEHVQVLEPRHGAVAVADHPPAAQQLEPPRGVEQAGHGLRVRALAVGVHHEVEQLARALQEAAHPRPELGPHGDVGQVEERAGGGGGGGRTVSRLLMVCCWLSDKCCCFSSCCCNRCGGCCCSSCTAISARGWGRGCSRAR